MSGLTLIDWLLASALIWLGIGIAGIFLAHRFTLVSRGLFPLGALNSIVLAILALTGIVADPQELILPVGLPGLPFHLRLDALSSFFLFLLGATSAGISTRPSSGSGRAGAWAFMSPKAAAMSGATLPGSTWPTTTSAMRSGRYQVL